MANTWGVRIDDELAIEGGEMDDYLALDLMVQGLVHELLGEQGAELAIHKDVDGAYWSNRYYEISFGSVNADFYLTEDGDIEGEHGSPYPVHWWATDVLGKALAVALRGTYWDSGVGDIEVDHDVFDQRSYEEYLDETNDASPDGLRWAHKE